MNKIAIEKDLDVRIDSAGLFAAMGEKASPNAVKAVEEMGADLSEHTAKSITEDLINASDIILAMTESHKQLLAPVAKGKVYTLLEYALSNGDIIDPYGSDLDRYRECASEIYDALLEIAKKIAGNKD